MVCTVQSLGQMINITIHHGGTSGLQHCNSVGQVPLMPATWPSYTTTVFDTLQGEGAKSLYYVVQII